MNTGADDLFLRDPTQDKIFPLKGKISELSQWRMIVKWIIVTLKLWTIGTRTIVKMTPKTAEIGDVHITESSYLNAYVSDNSDKGLFAFFACHQIPQSPTPVANILDYE